jgi:hypothetical protein
MVVLGPALGGHWKAPSSHLKHHPPGLEIDALFVARELIDPWRNTRQIKSGGFPFSRIRDGFFVAGTTGLGCARRHRRVAPRLLHPQTLPLLPRRRLPRRRHPPRPNPGPYGVRDTGRLSDPNPKDELMEEAFYDKRNDLFAFHQSHDLATTDARGLAVLIQQLYSAEFRAALSAISGLNLNANIDGAFSISLNRSFFLV